MPTRTPTIITASVTGLLLLVACVVHAESWPAWRGDALGSGITSETKLPLEWTRDKNVRWRIELPERGNSTPVVWGDRIFVTQAIEAKKWRGVMCFNRADGKLLWKNGVTYSKAERTHPKNPYCSASPVTDGERVIVYYGSAGMACYDFAGKELWKQKFGAIDHIWGNSTSPVLYGDLVIQYHGPGPGAFLVALNKSSGKKVWGFSEPQWKVGKRTDGFRGKEDNDIIGSFSTPIIVDSGVRDELVMSFPMDILALNPKTGKPLWRCGGLNPLVYTSPMYADGVVVAMGGYQGNTVAVKAGGDGNVTNSHRMWQKVRHNGGIGTGVIKDGYVYYQSAGGVAYCMEIKTGKTLWENRLTSKGGSWGSFMLAGDRVYSLSQAGQAVVFKADPAGFKMLAKNEIGETTNSSLVVSDGQIFIRTHEALWCISAPDEKGN